MSNLEKRLRAKAAQIRHDRPDTLGRNLSVLLLEAADALSARVEREVLNAAWPYLAGVRFPEDLSPATERQIVAMLGAIERVRNPEA